MVGPTTHGPTRRDLAVVLGLLALTWLVVLVPGSEGSALRTAVVVPAAVVLPGYAVLWALAPDPAANTLLGEPLARAVFAVALGVATVISLGVLIAAGPIAMTTWSALGGLTAVTVTALGVAAYRRPVATDMTGQASPEPAQETGSTWRTIGQSLVAPVVPFTADEQTLARTIGVVVLLVGVVGLGASAYLLVIHDQPGYVEFGVDPVGGETASAVAGTPLEVTILHEEPQASTYTVLAQIERAEGPSGEAGTIREVDRFEVALGDGETWSTRHVPPAPWEAETRAAYYLYRGEDVEGEPDARAHRWIEDAAEDRTPESEAVMAGGGGGQ